MRRSQEIVVQVLPQVLDPVIYRTQFVTVIRVAALRELSWLLLHHLVRSERALTRREVTRHLALLTLCAWAAPFQISLILRLEYLALVRISNILSRWHLVQSRLVNFDRTFLILLGLFGKSSLGRPLLNVFILQFFRPLLTLSERTAVGVIYKPG